MPVLVAVAAILGHNFPVYLKFRGGKGVATSLGSVFALDAVASGTRVIQENVMAPIRQVGGWMSAIRSGMDILRGGGTGDRRARRNQRAERNFG